MSVARLRLIDHLIEKGDRRSLAVLELMRPFSLCQRVKNAAYHWSKP